MSAKVFVDTNVLVYARDDSEGDKQARAAEWLAALWEKRAGCLSRQVLHEYYVTVTQKLSPGLPPAHARSDVRDLEAWHPIGSSLEVIEDAWRLQDRYRLSFWDGLIVSAARATGCNWLLTEDLQTGQDVAGVQVVSPFSSRPAELL